MIQEIVEKVYTFKIWKKNVFPFTESIEYVSLPIFLVSLSNNFMRTTIETFWEFQNCRYNFMRIVYLSGMKKRISRRARNDRNRKKKLVPCPIVVVKCWETIAKKKRNEKRLKSKTVFTGENICLGIQRLKTMNQFIKFFVCFIVVAQI